MAVSEWHERSLEAIRRMSEHPDVTWTFDDVVAALNNHKAQLVALTDGFAVLQANTQRDLRVWIAAAHGGHTQNLAASFAPLVEFATKFGYRRIIFGTHRKGWQRVAHKLGFQREGNDYYLNLEVSDVGV